MNKSRLSKTISSLQRAVGQDPAPSTRCKCNVGVGDGPVAEKWWEDCDNAGGNAQLYGADCPGENCEGKTCRGTWFCKAPEKPKLRPTKGLQVEGTCNKLVSL
jgi:hypothetical protein